MFNGGSAALNIVSQSNGAIAMCQGGTSFSATNCWSDGVPDKYWFANFTNRLAQVRIDNTGCPHPIKQAQHTEAAIRLMQVDDAELDGLNVLGSKYKQAVQSRPGGHGKPGREHYTRHVWRKCNISGGAGACFDAGNFKDPTDVNFPFGTLDLLRLEDCVLDGFELTSQGANPLTFDQQGIRQVQIVNTRIGGKLVNQTITH